MTNYDDIQNALQIFETINEQPDDRPTEDEALSILMAVSDDPATIHTNHPSTSQAESDDPATALLESIASGERDDINYLVGLATGQTANETKGR